MEPNSFDALVQTKTELETLAGRLRPDSLTEFIQLAERACSLRETDLPEDERLRNKASALIPSVEKAVAQAVAMRDRIKAKMIGHAAEAMETYSEVLKELAKQVAEPLWLDREIVIKMHAWCIAAWGGTSGIRDLGLLDSALGRPQMIHDYRPEATIHELAAAYAYSICRNHPFVDGNKRVAFLSTEDFLWANGWQLTANDRDLVTTIVAVISRSDQRG